MNLFAMLTCDEVLIDGKTGKHSIIGHFSSVKASSFPASHPSLTLFIGLTDVPAGDHQLELKFGLPLPSAPPAKKKKSLWHAEGPPPDPMKTLLEQTLVSRGPAQKIYFIAELTELTFEKEGVYQLALFIDKEPVGAIGLGVES